MWEKQQPPGVSNRNGLRWQIRVSLGNSFLCFTFSFFAVLHRSILFNNSTSHLIQQRHFILNLITTLYHPIRSDKDCAGTLEHVLLSKHYSNTLLFTHFKMADSHITTARAPGSGLMRWLAFTLLARPALANMPAVLAAPSSAAYIKRKGSNV